MSIEMENPQTPLEKADAIGNLIEQMSLAILTGDTNHFNKTKEKASQLNFELVQQLQPDDPTP